VATGGKSALSLNVHGAIFIALAKEMAADAFGIGLGAGERGSERLLDRSLGRRLQLLPFVLREEGRNEVLVKSIQRIACFFLCDESRVLVRLSILSGMAAQPRNRQADEGGSFPCSDPIHRLLERDRRLRRGRPVALKDLQVGKRGKVPGNVAAGRLLFRRDRERVPVVFDVEKHRQPQRGRNRETGPKAIRRHRSFAAEDDGNCSSVGIVLEHVRMVKDCLRPACGRRVL
jgi:hypothetical protein